MVFYYDTLGFRYFLFVCLFVGMVTIIAKGKSRSHLSSADSTNRVSLELFVLDRNNFKNYRFVVVDFVCMFNLSLLVTALATTTTTTQATSESRQEKCAAW